MPRCFKIGSVSRSFFFLNAIVGGSVIISDFATFLKYIGSVLRDYISLIGNVPW